MFTASVRWSIGICCGALLSGFILNPYYYVLIESEGLAEKVATRDLTECAEGLCGRLRIVLWIRFLYPRRDDNGKFFERRLNPAINPRV